MAGCLAPQPWPRWSFREPWRDAEPDSVALVVGGSGGDGAAEEFGACDPSRAFAGKRHSCSDHSTAGSGHGSELQVSKEVALPASERGALICRDNARSRGSTGRGRLLWRGGRANGCGYNAPRCDQEYEAGSPCRTRRPSSADNGGESWVPPSACHAVSRSAQARLRPWLELDTVRVQSPAGIESYAASGNWHMPDVDRASPPSSSHTIMLGLQFHPPVRREPGRRPLRAGPELRGRVG
jgi:hypothetical protein